MKKIVYLAAIAIVAVSCGQKKRTSDVGSTASSTALQDKVSLVEVVTATRSTVSQDETYASTVEPYAINNIAPQTGGRIREIGAEVGDYVYKGHVMARMDRLQLDQTRLQLQNDSTELSRVKALYEKGGIAQSDYEAMELAYKVRKSTYENLKENTVLTTPITGYVTARNYDRGDLYGMAQPIFTVQQVVPVKLLVGISESEYTRVKKGDSVTLTADALPGKTFTGRVSRIHPTINAATHTFSAEVIVQNSDRVLRPGMYARVKVTFGQRESIVIPDQCIVKQEGTGQRFVYIVNEDSTVSFVPVSLGRHIGTSQEVLDGIPDGARVVFKGHAALKDGSKVEIK